MSNGYLTLARIDGDPEALLDGYRRTAETMDGVGGDHGLLMHAAARTEEGLLIVNLWPSPDGSESAARDPRRLGSLREQGGVVTGMRREHRELERFVLFEREPAGAA